MYVNNIPREGRVEVITGCMFSGKTKELIDRVEQAKISQQNVVAIKPDIDTRYDNKNIVAHEQSKINAIPISRELKNVRSTVNEIKSNKNTKYPSNIDVIAIDEGNLFSNNLYDFVQTLSEHGYRIIISGLDTNYKGEPFEPMPKILSIADLVTKKYAVCEKCQNTATRTQKLEQNNEEIEVGGEQKYEPRCKKCHTKPQDS